MLKPTSSTQLAAYLFVDSRWHEPHDAVQRRAHGSSFEFLSEFQTEFFVRVSSCSRNEPFDYRGSTLCRYCCCCVVVVVAAAAAAVDIRPYVGVEAGKIVVSSLRYAFSEFVHVHLLDHRRVALQFSAGPRYFHHRQNVQIGSEVHPGSYNNGYRG